MKELAIWSGALVKLSLSVLYGADEYRAGIAGGVLFSLFVNAFDDQGQGRGLSYQRPMVIVDAIQRGVFCDDEDPNFWLRRLGYDICTLCFSFCFCLIKDCSVFAAAAFSALFLLYDTLTRESWVLV